MNRIVFTCGDINGIGPEIVLKTLQRLSDRKEKTQITLISPVNIFESEYRKNNCNFDYTVIHKKNISNDSHLFNLLPLPDVNQETGKPTRQSGKTAFLSLSGSIKLLKEGRSDAVVTAPVSKYALRLAGINFPGQTEMFAEWCNTDNYMMTFLSARMNAGLVSIHTPLKSVHKKISLNSIRNAIKLLIETSEKDLGILQPAIAVLGLNPHAGEEGLIGDEELKYIIPAIKEFSRNGVKVEGPFPADAFFGMNKYKKFNFILGMYHDQILPPFKLLNFNSGVNYTAGLPVVRTSPDHGCAFDIAGLSTANESSFYSAYRYAKKIITNRTKYSA